MTPGARSRFLAGATLLVVVASGGCGAPSDSSPASSRTTSRTATVPTPAPVDVCTGSNAEWQPVGGVAVAAASTGSGPTVVFANMSGNDACAWLPLVEQLAAAGHRCVLFRYTDPGASHEKASVSETLALAAATADGHRFALVGASLGGRIVIEAAGRHPHGLAAIVSLSGETTVEDYGDIRAQARKVRSPALYVGASDDPLTHGASQQKALHAAMHGTPNVLLERAGSDHGTALVDEPGGVDARTRARIVAFLDARLP